MARENQFKRRWDVLQVLQKHRFGVAIEDIVSKMGCSRRSIERDLNTLKDVGFPIKCETRDHGKKFWSIERDFLSADKLLIEPTEVMGLYIAGQFLAPLNNTPYGEGLKTLLDKISKIMPKSALNYFSALNETVYLKQTSGISSYGTEHIGTIQKAIDEKVSDGTNPYTLKEAD